MTAPVSTPTDFRITVGHHTRQQKIPSLLWQPLILVRTYVIILQHKSWRHHVYVLCSTSSLIQAYICRCTRISHSEPWTRLECSGYNITPGANLFELSVEYRWAWLRGCLAPRGRPRLRMTPSHPHRCLEGAWRGEGRRWCHKAGGIPMRIDGWGSRTAPYGLRCTVHHQMAIKLREGERGGEREERW